MISDAYCVTVLSKKWETPIFLMASNTYLILQVVYSTCCSLTSHVLVSEGFGLPQNDNRTNAIPSFKGKVTESDQSSALLSKKNHITLSFS